MCAMNDFRVTIVSIKVPCVGVFVSSASAFDSADNTYLDLNYSGYHKNLI